MANTTIKIPRVRGAGATFCVIAWEKCGYSPPGAMPRARMGPAVRGEAGRSIKGPGRLRTAGFLALICPLEMRTSEPKPH